MQQVVLDLVLPSDYRILRETRQSNGMYYVSVLSGEFMIDMGAALMNNRRILNEVEPTIDIRSLDKQLRPFGAVQRFEWPLCLQLHEILSILGAALNIKANDAWRER
jgi:hypothetical protein